MQEKTQITAAEQSAWLAGLDEGRAQTRKPLTDGEIIAAQESLIAAKDELYRSRIGLKCSHCKTGTYRADGNGYNDFHRCDNCLHVPMWLGDGKELTHELGATNAD
ncbi:MAG: hypothetical protein RSE32_03325 [Comamonas sp.]|uniref:hypothetical protein n=1 Tax=Comamonas sp. TaxID=34028 RepID=UPI002FCA4322